MAAKIPDQDVRFTNYKKLKDLETIGAGGFGLVFKAKHNQFGTVAFKKLEVAFVNKSTGDQLMKEAKIHFSLDHPNIVKIHALIFEQPHYGLVLEYMDNGEMIDFLRERKINWEKKQEMINGVASAMSYLHGMKPPIIHGDLKIQNVLIDKNCQTKICDFGFSEWKAFTQSISKTTDGSIRGTITHIPPEQWNNPGQIKETFDVYSFGIFLWELMTERKPFEGVPYDAIKLHVTDGKRPDLTLIPSDVPNTAVELMKECWSQNTKDRPTFSVIVNKFKTPKNTANSVAKSTFHLLFKLLLIGDSGVGKTCVLLRFSDDAFNTTFITTIGLDFKIKTIEIEGQKIKLQIWDTAGQERFYTITTAYYRGAMGIMLVYDITSSKSFDSIKEWLRNVEEHANPDVEKMILGNKCDIEDSRQVPKEKAEEFAGQLHIPFFETSAKCNINIEAAFFQLSQAILIKVPCKDFNTTSRRNNEVDIYQKDRNKTGGCCSGS